jgi:hypothetical protein
MEVGAGAWSSLGVSLVRMRLVGYELEVLKE